jgi:hypothetical protein
MWVLVAGVTPAEPPYPPSPVIKEVRFDWTTHKREAPGSDNWPTTWADDGHQYAAWGDGGGFGGTNSLGRVSLGIARIEGDWNYYRGFNVWGGHNAENPATFPGKSYGIICIDGVLAMWVTHIGRDEPFQDVKLMVSRDHGATWQSADWSFTRAEHVMVPTICQFGQNYALARDEYVYHYLLRFRSLEGPDDYPDKAPFLNVQKPGAIDLARVPKDRMLQRSQWTFFAGLDNAGQPTWTADLAQRKPVFQDPTGVGWCMSVSYNAGLGRYILCTEHGETHRGKPGMFDAREPWGPWTTVLYEDAWGDGKIPLNTFYWLLPTKWMSRDGKDFSLIFCGRKENDSWNTLRGTFVTR